MVIVVFHRRSACWSFSLKILEAGQARLRSEPMMIFVHVHSATIASIVPTNAAKAESAVREKRAI